MFTVSSTVQTSLPDVRKHWTLKCWTALSKKHSVGGFVGLRNFAGFGFSTNVVVIIVSPAAHCTLFCQWTTACPVWPNNCRNESPRQEYTRPWKPDKEGKRLVTNYWHRSAALYRCWLTHMSSHIFIYLCNFTFPLRNKELIYAVGYNKTISFTSLVFLMTCGRLCSW